MSSIEADFKKAAEDVKVLEKRPDNNALLKLYGLFKQANYGDCNDSRPSMFQFEAKAKWEAWKSNNGLSKENAMKQYVDLVNSLKQS